ncbi:MAG TPA: tetratricopeptide repeat protein [Rhizomicrobium sp.]|nr:tetratricopeptide repeat protein [Rhizomicrobium sp.]
MTSSNFRALAAALLLTTASAGGLALLAPATAEAATVRPQVGAALQAAIRDASSGNGNAALQKIREAESQPNLTPQEQQAIEQTKNYVAAKTGAGGGAVGAKAKFANDYNAGRYSAVVGPDADELRKSGAFDAQSELIVAQSYYLMHNYPECVRYIHDMGRVGQQALELLNRCAYEAGDEQAQMGALEQLVVDLNQTKYWSDLLALADRTPQMSTPDTLDVYRLRLLTGTMRNQSDYETAAEVAIQLGFPSEGATFAQKGLDSKQLPPDRGAKLLNLAKGNAAADLAALPKTQAAASAAKNGDADVKLGEDFWGMGRYQDAVNAIKAGIAKGPTNPDEAQIHLAMAYIGLHQRDQALAALKAVSKSAPVHTQMIARLWSIYARTH